ncbi:MAG: hypothetical protein ACLSH6_10315 [Limosilactobacillus pontis]
MVLNSDSTYKSQDIDELYNLFNNPKALQKSINGLDVQNTTLIATNEDKGSQTLAKLYNAETSTELNNLVENYQNGNATAAQNPTVLMIPELGENDELIPGKYAGRMILYYKGLGSDEGSPELKVMYSSMDPGYRGKLPSIYNYLGGGDAECAGMLYYPKGQQLQLLILMIRSTSNYLVVRKLKATILIRLVFQLILANKLLIM